MTTEAATDSAGYWYDERTRADAVTVLNALRRYRSAANAARRRAREALGVGENALLALQVLLDAEQAGQRVNSKQLAEELGITAASTSALVDRLVRSGHVERHPDPHDRRGVFLTASGGAMRQALEVLDELDDSGASVASRLDHDDVRVIVSFLDEMTRVVDDIAPDDLTTDDVALA